jgi:CAAX prenyl protease-like protein
MPTRATLAAVLPFAVWMALMSLLPQTAAAYAWRTLFTFAALMWAASVLKPVWRAKPQAWLWGTIGGCAVAAFWIFPENTAFYRTWLLWPFGSEKPAAAEPSPYNPAVCGWFLTLVKVVGSAFVIAPVEELFFRSFLYRRLQARDWRAVPLARFDGPAFCWMVALFCLEHPPRFVVAAACAAVYGWLAVRQGTLAAVVAHVVTNLLLALHVVCRGAWHFW